MTTEMFGAPYGIQQAEHDINSNALAGLQAQRLLGEIAEQPAHKQLVESHAKLYAAQATKAEQDAREAAGWNDFQKGALAKLGAAPEAGTPATQGAQSQADPVLQMGQLAFKGGFLKPGTQLLEKGTLIMQHEAAAASSRATAQLTQLKIQREQLMLAGSAAGSVVDQQSYDTMRMSLAAQGRDVAWMPADYESAKPVLAQVMQQSMTAVQQLHAKEEKLRTDSMLTHQAAQNKLSAARIGEVDASIKLKKARTEHIIKNGGDGSPLAQEAKRALIESRKARQAQIEHNLYPPLPTSAMQDPKLRVVGQTYSLPKGRFTWNGAGWVPFAGKTSAAAPVISAADEDSSDEEDE